MFKTRYGDYTIVYVKELLAKEDKTFYEQEVVKDIKERIYDYYCNIRSISCGNPCRGVTKEEVQTNLKYDLIHSQKGYSAELIDFIMLMIMQSSMR